MSNLEGHWRSHMETDHFNRFDLYDVPNQELEVEIIKTQLGYVVNNNKKKAGPEIVFKDNSGKVYKPLFLCTKNGDKLGSICGTKDMKDFIGLKVVLYVEPTVKMMGKVTGGVRIKDKPIALKKPEIKESEISNAVQCLVGDGNLDRVKQVRTIPKDVEYKIHALAGQLEAKNDLEKQAKKKLDEIQKDNK